MSKAKIFIVFFYLVVFPATAHATVDLRLGGSFGLGIGNNDRSIPKLDEGHTQTFTHTGYNVDLIMSDYWIVIGARAEESSAKSGTFFYFDQTANEYTKYGVKYKGRTYSGIVGIHFELNTPVKVPNGNEVLYSAGIYGVIPFDQSNEIEIESHNSTATSKVTGSAQKQEQWSVYLEANRAAKGGFIGGLQIGYRQHKLKEFEDFNQNPLTDYQGNPLELDLSHIDFRIFLGIRF